MSSDRIDDVVAEYLTEIEQRLHGLPVLQRRELLGDLEAHIVNERAERGVSSETELLAVLERLGSPEVVAAAAYEEAGLPQPADPVDRVFAGTVTFSSSRFTGRAERTAPVDTSEVAAMVAAAGAPTAGLPASAPPVPAAAPGLAASAPGLTAAASAAGLAAAGAAPASAAPAWVPPSAPAPQAYVPPAPAAVIPPPDDLRRTRPGPFPPSGPGFRPPTSAPPPFVGGPPMAPPPLPRRPGTGGGSWARALIAGAVALAFVVFLGCLGGAFLVSRDGGPASEPAVVVPAPVSSEFPPDPPAVPDEQATEATQQAPEPTDAPTGRPTAPTRPTAVATE
ncbi:HAAS signaling domain-containing protein [Actinoplanes sp. NPDC049681]|uniref:HAAS signaling domain-containing protein n=1 Tax=Actinoplanes sp. NPDC049681 TaxID=3363905 RepID=UPI0037944368